MQAMKVYRLADGTGADSDPVKCRYYLDSVRVSRGAFYLAHGGRRTDTYQSKMQTRRGGSTLVREYHCIRTGAP